MKMSTGEDVESLVLATNPTIDNWLEMVQDNEISTLSRFFRDFPLMKLVSIFEAKAQEQN